MHPLVLRMLIETDQVAFESAIDAFDADDSDTEFAFHYDRFRPFSDYVRRLEAWTRGDDLPEKFVPNTYLVGVVDGRIVGRLSLRQELNDYLREFGGHVGYAVVPSERNRGYATDMLRYVIPIASGLGISSLLVTCDDDNMSSEKVILHNGGIFEDTRFDESVGKTKKRFWIDLSNRLA